MPVSVQLGNLQGYGLQVARTKPLVMNRGNRFATLDGHDYMVEEVLDQWYGPQAFSKSAPVTAISTFWAEKHRRPTDLGIWSHSGNCHVAEGSPIISSRPSFSAIS